MKLFDASSLVGTVAITMQHVESFSSLQSLMFQSTLFLLRIEARQPQHRSGMFSRVGEMIGLIFTPVQGSI